MIRNFIYKSSPLIAGILPFDLQSADVVSKDSETVKSILARRSNETGRDRLYYMYSVDEFGNLSPELNSSLQVGFLGLFIGAMFGGITQSRIAYLNFMENNQATAFKNHLEAKKKLQDQVTVNFGKGAFKWGWRLGMFSTSYVLITTSISVYRGKSSIVEYLVGGGVTGALYKFSMGPRGMLVGGALGTCLGAVAGGLSLGLLKLAGISMEEVRYWQYKFHEERQEKFRKVIKEHKAKEDMEIFKEYSQRQSDAKHTLDSIDIEESTQK